MYRISITAALLAASLFILSGCDKDDESPLTPEDPFAGLTKVAEGYAAGAGMKVQLWSKSALYTGYNAVVVAVFDSASGAAVTDAHVSLMPMMDMGTMKHSSPYENPSGIVGADGKYPANIVFIMSSMGGTWTVSATVHNHHTDKEGTAVLTVPVSEPSVPVMRSITAKNDSAKLFISYLKPASLKVGINDFEVTIHRRASMMSFPADSGYTVVITPEMPSMGHGSPNNVNPSHSGAGHYKGKVNFTMTGEWRINLDIYKNSAVVDTTLYFDITL